MRRTFAPFLLVIIALLCPGLALGGLIVNGDFESNFAPNHSGIQVGGPIDGWTLSGPPSEWCWGEACSGLRESMIRGVVAWFGDEQVNFVSQNIATTPGDSYLLSAWLVNAGPDSGSNQFEFWWDGTLVGSLTDAEPFGWTQFSFLVTATSASTEVKLGGSNPPSIWMLDSVDVNQVPEPASLPVCGAALAGLAACGLRRVSVRRKLL
jgi:hypothetical protein